MALLYPAEAFAVYGPSIRVYDANGKMLKCVLACDPLTGEVIEARLTAFSKPASLPGSCYAWLCRHLYKAWRIDIGYGLPRIHRFAPAPLQLCEVGYEWTMKVPPAQKA